jgi:hypothetical protein
MKRHKSIFVLLFALTLSACDEALDLVSDDLRDQFTGTWDVKENTTLKTDYTYTVTISKSDYDTTAVLIKNFYQIGSGTSVEGIVAGDKVTLPSQTVSGFTIKGYGIISFNGNTINWSYSVDYNNGDIDEVTATYTKQ